MNIYCCWCCSFLPKKKTILIRMWCPILIFVILYSPTCIWIRRKDFKLLIMRAFILFATLGGGEPVKWHPPSNYCHELTVFKHRRLLHSLCLLFLIPHTSSPEYLASRFHCLFTIHNLSIVQTVIWTREVKSSRQLNPLSHPPLVQMTSFVLYKLC